MRDRSEIFETPPKMLRCWYLGGLMLGALSLLVCWIGVKVYTALLVTITAESMVKYVRTDGGKVPAKPK